MIENHIAYAKTTNWLFKVTKAEGSYLWDENGRRLIDFTAGWNVANLGWNHPEVVQATIDQLKKVDFVSGWTSTDIQEEYAQSLAKALPEGLNVVFRATGGTEANEVAFKIAWAATRRKKF